MSPLIEARDLTYCVRGRALVEGAGLTVTPGEFVVIVGPNGAGKSTLVKLLSGELTPDAGTIRYDGAAIAELPPWRLACKRAVLPQASRLSFPFSVFEVARLGRDGIGRAAAAVDRDAAVWHALEAADVAHLAERNYQTLSGGEQQRVQFARVLCQLEAGRTIDRRQVLFLDEPIASLDLKHQIALLDAARRLAADGVGIVAILHDLNLSAAYADTLVAMKAGRVVAAGPPARVLTDALVQDVFEVPLRVGAVPSGLPFLLPQRSQHPVERERA